MPQFFTKSGWLTPYAMACGYIQKTEKPGETIIMEHCSAGGFFVEHWQRGATGAHGTGGILRDGIAYRAHFESICEARKAYRERVGALQWRYESAPDIARNVIV